jgi:hypothetical protein
MKRVGDQTEIAETAAPEILFISKCCPLLAARLPANGENAADFAAKGENEAASRPQGLS